jgi:hypothetical protein
MTLFRSVLHIQFSKSSCKQTNLHVVRIQCDVAFSNVCNATIYMCRERHWVSCCPVPKPEPEIKPKLKKCQSHDYATPALGGSYVVCRS